jgi:hypothetical protein
VRATLRRLAGGGRSAVGILNVIYGIAAIGDSKFFVADQKYILSGRHTWGWVMLIVGALQIAAAFSIWNGGSFGRWFGITCAGLTRSRRCCRSRRIRSGR